MEDYNFINNVGEKFTFLLDEADNFCLKIRFKDELIACFNMNKEEMNGIVEWKKKADDYKDDPKRMEAIYEILKGGLGNKY